MLSNGQVVPLYKRLHSCKLQLRCWRACVGLCLQTLAHLGKTAPDPFAIVKDELETVSERLRRSVLTEVPVLSRAASYFFQVSPLYLFSGGVLVSGLAAELAALLVWSTLACSWLSLW